MRSTTRLALAASCLTVFTTACGDSTSPGNTQTAAQLAVHFDSLFHQAYALSDSGTNGYFIRAQLMTFLELPASLGALPSSVTVTTASGNEVWKGFEVEEVGSSGPSATDSDYVVIAYKEPDAHTVFLASYNSSGTFEEGGIVVHDTVDVAGTPVSGTTSPTSVGAACATPSPSLTNPVLATLGNFTCTSATFNTSASMTVSDSTGLIAPYTSFSFASTSFHGVRIVETSSTAVATARAARALLHRLNTSHRL